MEVEANGVRAQISTEFGVFGFGNATDFYANHGEDSVAEDPSTVNSLPSTVRGRGSTGVKDG